MEHTSPYVCQLTESEKQYVATHLNENDEVRQHAIDEIRNWIMENAQLHARTDDFSILRFLRACKFDISKTKKKLKNYHAQRAKLPEWYANRDPRLSELQELFDLGVFLPLRELDEDGRMIIITRTCVHDPNKHKQADVLKVTLCLRLWPYASSSVRRRFHACLFSFFSFNPIHSCFRADACGRAGRQDDTGRSDEKQRGRFDTRCNSNLRHDRRHTRPRPTDVTECDKASRPLLAILLPAKDSIDEFRQRACLRERCSQRVSLLHDEKVALEIARARCPQQAKLLRTNAAPRIAGRVRRDWRINEKPLRILEERRDGKSGLVRRRRKVPIHWINV